LKSPHDFRCPSPKKCRCRGQTFTAGNSDACGSGGRAGCASCTVRDRGGRSRCLWASDSNLINYIRFRAVFYMEKHFSKTEHAVRHKIKSNGFDLVFLYCAFGSNCEFDKFGLGLCALAVKFWSNRHRTSSLGSRGIPPIVLVTRDTPIGLKGLLAGQSEPNAKPSYCASHEPKCRTAPVLRLSLRPIIAPRAPQMPHGACA
jgi:hypothetical protein